MLQTPKGLAGVVQKPAHSLTLTLTRTLKGDYSGSVEGSHQLQAMMVELQTRLSLEGI